MTRARLVAAATLMIAAVLAVASGPRLAHGHAFEPYLLDLRERADGDFDAAWREPGEAQPGGRSGAGGARPVFPDGCRSMEVGDPRGASNVGAGSDAGEARRLFARLHCDGGSLRGREISFAGIGSESGSVIIRLHGHDGSVATGVLHGGGDRWLVPSAGAGAAAGGSAAVLARYVALGVEHILTGWDHLLFVLGLVLLVGWGRPLLVTITAFTVAHSITLALAALDVVHVPSPPVEAAIAVSIVLVAVEAAQPRDAAPTLGARFPWAIAFLFGLLHGLGFAGALAEVGLPQGQIPLALLAFNVGVELGQLAFVLALWPFLGLAQRIAERAPMVARVPAYAIGSVGFALVWERVLSFGG